MLRPATIHLLHVIGRRAAFTAALMAMVLSLLRAPCLLEAALSAGNGPTAAAIVSLDAGTGLPDAADPDECGLCHCSSTMSCVVPGIVALTHPDGDPLGLSWPLCSQIPDDLARVPDVPPDQA